MIFGQTYENRLFDQPRIHKACYPVEFVTVSSMIRSMASIDRWLNPPHRYFKVRGDDDDICILRHDISHNTGEMTLYDSGMRDDTRLSST